MPTDSGHSVRRLDEAAVFAGEVAIRSARWTLGVFERSRTGIRPSVLPAVAKDSKIESRGGIAALCSQKQEPCGVGLHRRILAVARRVCFETIHPSNHFCRHQCALTGRIDLLRAFYGAFEEVIYDIKCNTVDDPTIHFTFDSEDRGSV